MDGIILFFSKIVNVFYAGKTIMHIEKRIEINIINFGIRTIMNL